MKRLIILTIALLFPQISSGMETTQFDALIKKIQQEEFTPVEQFLKSQKETLKNDPEYYVIFLNYAINNRKESFIIASDTPEKGVLEPRDTRTGKTAGFIGSKYDYNPQLIKHAIRETQDNMQPFQNRLDIHFGIITLAKTINNWDIIGNQLISILKISKENNNAWVWGNINSLDGDPKEFMIHNILVHTSNLFRAEESNADKNLKRVSLALVEYYPDLTYGYANLGVLNMAQKDYKNAEKWFKQALEKNPNDEIVSHNLDKLHELQSKK